MRIIEKSQHRCEKCGCLYEFDKSDYQTKSYETDNKLYLPPWDVKGEYLRRRTVITTFVNCPECGTAYQLGCKSKYHD